MNKILKLCVIEIMMLIALVVLTGCGDKINASMTEEDAIWGKCGINLEISFKDDKINKVKIVYELENETKAKAMLGLEDMLTSQNDDIKAHFKQNKNKVTIECNDEGFYQLYADYYRGLNKEKTIEKLKEEGFTIK